MSGEKTPRARSDMSYTSRVGVFCVLACLISILVPLIWLLRGYEDRLVEERFIGARVSELVGVYRYALARRLLHALVYVCVD